MARHADPNARSALVTAARREFLKCGLMRARVEDITAACGLSKGAFYLHFESKEALFGELVTAFQAAVGEHAQAREAAYLSLQQPKRLSPSFVDSLRDIDAREDRKLLELIWEWRDVCEVLLRGTAGTAFEGVLWEMLDAQVERVAVECMQLQRGRLIRDDVPGDMLGSVVVGTYMMLLRRLVGLEEKPDFTPWVTALQAVLTEGLGVKSRGAPAAARRRAPAPRPTRARRSSSSRRQD